MLRKISQNYSYANNSSHELINVSSARRNENYFCPICGESMTPHMGKIRRWHFVHKNIGECSYESYLHMLAKIKLREAFLSSNSLLLSYEAPAVCSSDCPFIDYPKCKSEKRVTFNLKDYYDTCELEVPFKQFRADLLLSSSKNPKLPPILIEIKVTHACSDEKINDGVRIIEIPISSEEDIDKLLSNGALNAVRYSSNFNPRYYEFMGNEIILYNFDKEVNINAEEYLQDFIECGVKNAHVFCLNKQGYFRTFECYCNEVNQNIATNVHYYLSDSLIPFKDIFQGFSKRGVKVRNCFVCKFSKRDNWDNRICVLYKKYNLERKPNPYNALNCPYYCEDRVMDQINCESSTVPQESQAFDKSLYHICKEIL